jgi:ABC-type amino acid transport substrate-binding protein
VWKWIATPALLAALVAGSSGCGDSGPERPELLNEGTLSIGLRVDPDSGPPGFHEELLNDLAERLNWETEFTPVDPGAEAGFLTARSADAAAPVPIRRLTASRLAYSAPYYEDPRTGVLYGIAILAEPGSEEETELHEDIDEALSELTDDGTLQQLYDKWFPGTEVPDRVLNDASR